MRSTPEPPFAPELVVDQPPHLLGDTVPERPIRPWRPGPDGYSTVAKLTAEDIGLTLTLQEPRTQLSERARWRGPAWAVVGELVAVSHRADATSLVLRIVGAELRLDVDPGLEVETPPETRV